MTKMEKKDKSKTSRTQKVGSTDYKGYCSKNVSNSYDGITQCMKDKASDLGGILDNDTEKYKGNRFRFSTKDARDNFNKELEKEKENKKSKKTVNEIISEVINEYLCEALKSPKLRQIASKHGGLGDKYIRHGKSDNWAWTRGGNSDVPLSDITDDMLADESDLDTDEYSNKSANGVVFRDGSTLPFKTPESALNISDELQNKQRDRRLRKGNDGSKEYVPSTNAAYHARHVRDVMNHGRNVNKTGEERAKEFGGNVPKHWREYIQNGKDIINNAKDAYKEFQKDGTFKDKTKRF